MHQPSKWWVGLIPIAALWVLANGVRAEPVEADVAARAKEVLTEAGDIASAMTTKALGRDVLIEGLEFADGDRGRMGQQVDQASGVRLVDWRLQRVLPARPFEFAATREQDRFRLTGSVPSPAIRNKVLAMAKDAGAGKEAIDNLAYAAGQPNDFESIVAYGLAEAAKLDDGSFALLDNGYSISGAAASFEIFDAAVAATKRLPAGLVLARAEILPPEIKPYRWDANSDGSSITLSGLAPSETVRGEIAGTAARLFPGRTIVDRTAIARGAPNGDFSKAAASALTELAKLTDGLTSMTDAQLSIRGHAPAAISNDAVAASIRSSLQAPFTVGLSGSFRRKSFRLWRTAGGAR